MQPAYGVCNRSAGKKTMPLCVLFICKTSKHTPYWYSGPSSPTAAPLRPSLLRAVREKIHA